MRINTQENQALGKVMVLFDDIIVEAPPTEGIKYTGSKLKLLPSILELAARTKATTVLDGFAGSTRVSQAFVKSGYRVVSNDIAKWSHVFATCYLLNRESASYYSELIKHLNNVPPRDGWFTQHYGGVSNEEAFRVMVSRNPGKSITRAGSMASAKSLKSYHFQLWKKLSH